MVGIVITALLLVFLGFLIFRFSFFSKKKNYMKADPTWRPVLLQKVKYYTQLNNEEQERFEKLTAVFLSYTKVTGIGFEADITDKLLVAASAIIPVMGISDFYSYPNINEVLLYPDRFNPENYDTEGNDRDVLGMVGEGVMNNKMILSRPALYEGFNFDSISNVGIHEFVHLIDMADGITDGCPAALLENQCSIPWMELIRRKINEIHTGKSDINPYGGKNKVEFFAVASEYFFQKPGLMKINHPELYDQLSNFFNQKI